QKPSCGLETIPGQTGPRQCPMCGQRWLKCPGQTPDDRYQHGSVLHRSVPHCHRKTRIPHPSITLRSTGRSHSLSQCRNAQSYLGGILLWPWCHWHPDRVAGEVLVRRFRWLSDDEETLAPLPQCQVRPAQNGARVHAMKWKTMALFPKTVAQTDPPMMDHANQDWS